MLIFNDYKAFEQIYDPNPQLVTLNATLLLTTCFFAVDLLLWTLTGVVSASVCFSEASRAYQLARHEHLVCRGDTVTSTRLDALRDYCQQ